MTTRIFLNEVTREISLKESMSSSKEFISNMIERGVLGTLALCKAIFEELFQEVVTDHEVLQFQGITKALNENKRKSLCDSVADQYKMFGFLGFTTIAMETAKSY